MDSFHECHDYTALLAKGQSLPPILYYTSLEEEKKKHSRTYKSLKLGDLGDVSCQILFLFPIQAFLVLFKCLVLVCVEKGH